MKYLSGGLVALAMLASIAGCASIPLEVIYAPISGAGWKVAYARDVRGTGNIVERVPAEETLNSWTKMITIQFMEGDRRTPEAFMEGLKTQMIQRCPAVDWSAIERDNSSILYEWRIQNCPGQQDQHEISRLLRGNDGLHRIAYVEKVQHLSKDVRDLWIANLKSGYLVKGESKTPVVLKAN